MTATKERRPASTPSTDELLRPPPPTWSQRLRNNRWLSFYTSPLLIALFLVAWKIYVEVTDLSRFVLPPPEAVFKAFAAQITDPFVWQTHIWTTFYEVMMGLALAIVLGVGLGLMIGKSPLFDRIVRPFIVGTQVVPKVALVPLFILWLGFGPSSKVVIAALLAFFPLLINTSFGVRSVPGSMHDLMTTLKASRWERFWRADLPYTMPFILAGMELAVVQATIGAIVGEYLGGDQGLGRYAVNLQNNLQVDKLFGAILIMALFGFTLYSIVTGARRLLIPWHESVQPRRRP
ncbi:ABC transporter permease [Micromonospora sp. DT48]|uniref:ABC transporter permease n=1 Tax=unclassified Micromonospora TaxID=2617518 RepID=UPI001327C6FB|nr:ABC transporter permease [Micromonospora sp. CP22]MTK02128.1 ABC transporter permease [Micromonospora sp. CP22]